MAGSPGEQCRLSPDRLPAGADPDGPADGMRTLEVRLAYDGGDFHGWQLQPDRPTIQAALIRAGQEVLGRGVGVVGASRTDAGVHALGQVASVRTSSRLTPRAVARALNARLPSAVRVLAAREAPAGFDARRWAESKRYVYVLDLGPAAHPFLRRFAWHVPVGLDRSGMTKALRHLRGQHDFSAFCASAGRGRTPFCTLRSARVVTRRQRLAIVISADSFLHHMVRNIVGSLVEVGRGARPADWVAEVLVGRDRRLAGPTAPAHGLTLLRVRYRRDGAGMPVRPGGGRSGGG